MDVLRKIAMLLGVIGAAVLLNVLVFDAYRDVTADGFLEVGARLEFGTALATAFSAYISALLGLKPRRVLRSFRRVTTKPDPQIFTHIVLFVGYVVAVVVAFAGMIKADWSDDVPGLLRSVAATALGAVIGTIGIAAGEAGASPAPTPPALDAASRPHES